ncbi:MAG: hypothetical protein ABEH42_12090 [Haloarculaceae archaeon]
MSTPTDPDSADVLPIDRFSEAAGTLMVRSPDNDLPGPNQPIDFDTAPFLTTGLGPDGGTIQYYNFDVQATEPAPIYAFFRETTDTPVDGQLNVVGTIPGDEGYNDFWHVHKVLVPDDYVANTVTSATGVMDREFDIQSTGIVKNCPIVPAGSTAVRRGGDADTGLIRGWYEDGVVNYFLFEEATLETTADGAVPTSPIYVTFNRNPAEEGGGPASGFMTESGSDQTHNVVATLPGDAGYSPLWAVNIYDNADFNAVSDLSSATAATILDTAVATVNCPVVAQP